jgi:uncharacterized membrane protein YhaH (DUF805 family)
MPSEDLYYDDLPPAAETVTEILFSFEGRINRAKYWGYSFVLIAILIIVAMMGMRVAGEAGMFSSYAIAGLFAIWPSLALGIKRCHDRNRSGWFMLVSLIPIVSIWYLIEVGFLRGTDGANEYGEDPLADF